MQPAFPVSDYYGPSVPSWSHQPTTSLPAAALAGRRVGPDQKGSHVHHQPFDGVGAQLCPCDIATTTPQTFTVASLPASPTSPGVLWSPRCASLAGPYLPDLSRCGT